MEINNLVVKTSPFQYFYGDLDINNDLLNKLIIWLKETENWNYVETDFYEQYEFFFSNANLPKHLNYFTSDTFITELKNYMSNIFEKNFENKVDIIAHKLIHNQTIRIHNDYLENEESDSHRLLIQLNSNWKEENGGFLMFFDEQEEVTDIILPTLGSIQGFEISKISNHAVSTINNAERYTLTFYFYEKI